MNAKKRTLTIAAWALLVFAPFLQMLFVFLFTGKNPFTAYPVWGDELGYWRSLYSWLHTGLQSGYSGMGEYPAAVGTLGLYGLTPILLYGGLAKVLGLTAHSIVLFNALWISLGGLAFCALVRPKATTALLIGGLLMVFVPAVLYCATSMTELFNYGLLLFYFAFLIRYQQKGRKWAALLCWCVVVLAMMYRMVYLALLIPLVWALARGRFGKRMVGFGLLGLGLAVGCGLLTHWVSAPARSSFLYNWFQAESFGVFWQVFLSHAKGNVYDYFVRPTDSPMEDALRCLYMAVMGLCLLGSFLVKGKVEGEPRLRVGLNWPLMGAFLLLFMPFGIVVMFFETNDWIDYRMLAPFLWGVVVLLAVRGRRVIPGVALAGTLSMLVLLCTLPPVGAFGDDYRFVEAPYSEALQQACQAVEYDPQAESPYDNSVRTDLTSLQMMMELPPGMGVFDGWFTPETVGKSRWILTDHLKIVVEGYGGVVSGKGANLYKHLSTPAQ